MKHDAVHRKWQPCLLAASCCSRNGRPDRRRKYCHYTHGQRVVEVSRVHLRALLRASPLQARNRSAAAATPCLHKSAVLRAILDANEIVAIVNVVDFDCARRQLAAYHCMPDMLPAVTAFMCCSTAAVHSRIGQQRIVSDVPTAHLKSAIGHRALHV